MSWSRYVRRTLLSSSCSQGLDLPNVRNAATTTTLTDHQPEATTTTTTVNYASAINICVNNTTAVTNDSSSSTPLSLPSHISCTHHGHDAAAADAAIADDVTAENAAAVAIVKVTGVMTEWSRHTQPPPSWFIHLFCILLTVACITMLSGIFVAGL